MATEHSKTSCLRDSTADLQAAESGASVSGSRPRWDLERDIHIDFDKVRHLMCWAELIEKVVWRICQRLDDLVFRGSPLPHWQTSRTRPQGPRMHSALRVAFKDDCKPQN